MKKRTRGCFASIKTKAQNLLNWLLQAVQKPQIQVVTFFAVLVVLYLWRVFLKGEVLSAADTIYGVYPWKSLIARGFQPRNPWMPDSVDCYYPAQYLARNASLDEHFPLWNPYTSSGTPLATLVNYGLFYPLNLLAFIFPLEVGISYKIALGFFVAALGTYLFARELNLSHAAAAIGGVIYSFCAFNVVWTGSPHPQVSHMAPLTFFFTQRLFNRGRLGTTWGLALSVMAMLAGGFVSVAAYFLYALGAYAVVLTAQRCLKSKRNWRQAIRPLALWTLGIVAGFLLISMQLLPFAEFAGLTSYDEQRVALVERSAGSVIFRPLVREIVRLLVPDYYGHPIDYDWWGSEGVSNYVETSSYVGVLTWFLAALGVALGPRSRQRGFFLGLVVVCFGMVFHLPWRSVLVHLPIVNSSSTRRVASVMSLGLAVLAAIGADTLFRYAVKWKRQQKQTALLVTLLLAAVMMSLVAATDYHWQVAEGGTQAQHSLYYALRHLSDPQSSAGRLLSFLFWLGAGITIIALGVKRVLRGTPLAIATAALIVTDMFAFGMRYMPTLPPEEAFPITPGIEWLQTNAQGSRIAGVGSTLRPSTPSIYGLEDIRGHNPLRTDRYLRLLHRIDPTVIGHGHGTISQFSLERANFHSHWLDVIGVKFVAGEPGTELPPAPETRTPYEVVYDGADLIIYQNPNAAPRFYIAQRVFVEAYKESVLELIESTEFSPGADAVVEESLAALEGYGAPTGTVSVLSYEAERISLEANLTNTGLLVTAEKFYPGWKAYVDGVWTPVHRVNYAFRAIVVPAGYHHVEFVFEPLAFYAGAALSGSTAAAMLISLVLVRILRQRQQKPDTSPSLPDTPAKVRSRQLWRKAGAAFLVLPALLGSVILLSPSPDELPPPTEGMPVVLSGPITVGQSIPVAYPGDYRVVLVLSAPAGPATALIRLYDSPERSSELAFAEIDVGDATPRRYEVAVPASSSTDAPYLEISAPEATTARPVFVNTLLDETSPAPPVQYNSRPLEHLRLQTAVRYRNPTLWIHAITGQLDRWWWGENARFSIQTWLLLDAAAAVAALASLLLPLHKTAPRWLAATTSAGVVCSLMMAIWIPASTLVLSQGALTPADVRMRVGQTAVTATPQETIVVADLIAELGSSTTVIDTPEHDYVNGRWFDIGGDRRPVLWMHPPSAVYYTVEVSPGMHLHASAALDPEVWRSGRGDGVLFVVRTIADGTEETVYYQEIDPKNRLEDQKWHDIDIDLNLYIGQKITLLFITYPMETNDWDWAGWGMPVLLAPSQSSTTPQ